MRTFLQLTRVGHPQRAVEILFGADLLVVYRDGSGARLFQEVDATQEGAFARAAGANDADYVASFGLERYALEYFVVAVFLVQLIYA